MKKYRILFSSSRNELEKKINSQAEIGYEVVQFNSVKSSEFDWEATVIMEKRLEKGVSSFTEKINQ